MYSVYAEIIELLENGQSVVLARMIRQSGSTPRSIGTACLILPDGTIKGTIGGGALEYQVIQKAMEVFQSQRSSLLEFQLTGHDVAETDMICGGLADVYLEPLLAGDSSVIELCRETQAMLNLGRQGVMVTRVAPDTDVEGGDLRALVRQDGSMVGGLIDRGSGLEALRQEVLGCKRAVLREPDEASSGQRLFLEPLKPDSVLYLFGAGHVSTFVAPLAALAGFRVVVIDDREEFANTSRFPRADSILVCPTKKAFEKIEINPAAYIAIITRGHIHDHEVLEAALSSSQPAYIGMIGSLRKRNLIYRSLQQAGISAERLAQIHSPIGLAIGAETPAEIAVSIVAELIHVRALAPIAKTPFESNQPE